MFKTSQIAFFFIILSSLSCAAPEQKESLTITALQPHKIVGYVAGWKGVNVDKIPAEKLTHINYAFANVVDGLVVSGEGNSIRDSINFAKLHQLKMRNPKLKILVSIGGWSWSKGFSDAALTAESRERLTRSGIDFLIKHKLDGLDFDWEYPALQGDNNVVRDIDKENFVLMLQRFRQALDSLGAQDGRHYLSTIATGGFRKYLEVNDLAAAQEHLDFINIMSYDFYTAGDKVTGHHANLYPNGAKGRSASTTAEEHEEFGVPIHKIVLGVPFYGRMWEQVPPTDQGLFQPGNFKKGLPNSEIQKLLEDSAYVPHWDEDASAPFIYSARDSLWITYETERSIREKADYIKKHGLAGAMFWELSEDPSGVLLNALHEELGK